MFCKRKEKEKVVTISEVTTLSAIYYDKEGKVIPHSLNWSSSNSGLTYSKIGYKKIVKYKVESLKYFTNGNINTMFSFSFDVKEEAENVYKQLLEMNGENHIETIIDKKSFKK